MCDLLLLNWEVMLSSCFHGIYLVRVKIEFELDFGYRYIVICNKCCLFLVLLVLILALSYLDIIPTLLMKIYQKCCCVNVLSSLQYCHKIDRNMF